MRELDGVWTCPQCGVDRNSRKLIMSSPYIVHCDKCEAMRSAMISTDVDSMSEKEGHYRLEKAGVDVHAVVERLLNLIKEK